MPRGDGAPGRSLRRHGLRADGSTLADLATISTLPAEVELNRIPELLGEIERPAAVAEARLALRINRAAPAQDRLLVTADDAFRAEKRLMGAVLTHALLEYRKYAAAADPWSQRRFAEIGAWFAADEAVWPFAFVTICEALGLEVSRVRAALRTL